MSKMQPAKAKRPLTAAIYHDDNAAREHLETVLWGDAGATTTAVWTVLATASLSSWAKSTRPGVHEVWDAASRSL